MTWEKWALIGYIAYSALALVWRIGRPRKSVTHGEALIGLCEFGAVVALVVFA